MKTSIYNVFLPYKEKTILFNTLSRNSIITDNVLADLLSKNKTSLDNIHKKHPVFYETLCKQEFIINEKVDEVEKVEQLRLKSLKDSTQYHLTINPTLDCNFNCWYCYETKVKGSEMTSETVKSVSLLIKNILSENKDLNRFHLYFFGSEPLLKFDSVILPVIDTLSTQTKDSNILKTIQITTNGALITNRIINKIKQFNIFTSFQITFDGYGETHNKSRFNKVNQKSYNTLVQTIKQLLQNDLLVTLRINFTQNNIDELKLVLNDFKDLPEKDRQKIIYTPVRIWQDEPKRVTKDACEKIKFSRQDRSIVMAMNKSISYAKSLKMNVMPIESIDSVRCPCKHSYINAASINYNGDVFKCCARAFDDENKEGDLLSNGTIKWKDDTDIRILRKRTVHNNPCKSCIMFPICGGGCIQSFNDFADTEYCLYQYHEESKINAIKQYISIL